LKNVNNGSRFVKLLKLFKFYFTECSDKTQLILSTTALNSARSCAAWYEM